MKLYKILTILLLILSFMACTDEDNTIYNKGDQSLEVSASKASLELDAQNPNSEAIKFTWTTGTNNGSGLAIEYVFQLDKQGADFENGISIDMGRNIYEKSYKNEELNDLLIEKFGVTPNSEATFQYRIVAKIASGDAESQISPIQTINIIAHQPITKKLYLVGDATPNGWNVDDAVEMRAVTNTPKAFSWTGTLSEGEFKLITTLGKFLPSYNKGENDTKLVLRKSDSDPDNKFVITQAGTYTINVNLISMAISITKGEGPEFSQLWFVGNATGWSFKSMTVDSGDPFIFHYNADLSAGGEFKIATVPDFDGSVVFFRPKSNKQGAGTDLDVDKWAGDPDYKWDIAGGVYKITLDTRSMKIDIVPFTPYAMIYLVGDATPGGWDIGNAAPLTATSDPNKFTWTGTLNTGELKFTCDKQSDWSGDWFLASQNGIEPSGDVDQMLFSAGGANPDNKWKIATAGTYTIELDQLLQTVKIKKQ